MLSNIKINDKWKKVCWVLFSLFLACFTIRMVIKQSEGVSLSDIADTAMKADKSWFVFAILSASMFIIGEGGAIVSILKGAGYRTGFKNGLLYSTSDIFFSAVTPSATGGQPASAYFMMRDGIPAGVVTATLILNLMFYALSIVILGIIAIFIHPAAFFKFKLLSRILICGGFAVLCGLSAFFLLILRKGEKMFLFAFRVLMFFYGKGLIRRPDSMIARLRKAKMDYRQCSKIVVRKPMVLLYALLWNLFQRFCQLIVPAILYISVRGDVGKSIMVFQRQCLVTVGFNFVPVPGAMGVADYLMVDGFSEIVGREMAFHLEMLSRSMTFYICVSVSGIFTLIGFLLGRRRNDRSI